MTLSRFLRVYLYIPLGGNRKGSFRRYVNILITMLLGGLWHGAGWNFLIWGGLHGFYLIINHIWQILLKVMGKNSPESTYLGSISARVLTFIAVVIGWVVFRAESLSGALAIYKGMLALNGVSIPVQLADTVVYLKSMFPDLQIEASGLGSFGSPLGFIWLFGLLVLVWFAPNTIQFMKEEKNILGLEKNSLKASFPIKINWAVNNSWALATALIAVLSVLSLTSVSEFLYFQF